MDEMRINNYVLTDLLMYAPLSLPFDVSGVVTKDGKVKIKIYDITFEFEGDGIICIVNKSDEYPMKFDTHAWYCRNVAPKDMLQHLVNRYRELTERYNRLNEAVSQMLASLGPVALGQRLDANIEELLKDKPSE